MTDDQRNQLWELRYDACLNDDSCIHSHDPYSERGTSYHYPTCPRAKEQA